MVWCPGAVGSSGHYPFWLPAQLSCAHRAPSSSCLAASFLLPASTMLDLRDTFPITYPIPLLGGTSGGGMLCPSWQQGRMLLCCCISWVPDSRVALLGIIGTLQSSGRAARFILQVGLAIGDGYGFKPC